MRIDVPMSEIVVWAVIIFCVLYFLMMKMKSGSTGGSTPTNNNSQQKQNNSNGPVVDTSKLFSNTDNKAEENKTETTQETPK